VNDGILFRFEVGYFHRPYDLDRQGYRLFGRASAALRPNVAPCFPQLS
jgi:hypothetical protein